jgi:hypothetical protein
MVTVIKKGSSKSSILRLLNKIQSKRGVNVKKYCGVLKLKTDPLTIQRSLRNEWI